MPGPLATETAAVHFSMKRDILWRDDPPSPPNGEEWTAKQAISLKAQRNLKAEN
jgi:hypothetical protein